VKHEPHGVVSSYLTTMLQPGAVLDVAAPRGEFVLDGSTDPVVLLSAGIGLTPVLSMLHALADAGDGRVVWWVHGARSPQEQPLAAEAHDLLSLLPGSSEHIFYSGAMPADAADVDAKPGRLTKDTLVALGIPLDANVYLCGPAAFMASMQQALVEIGVEPGRIFTELFEALPAITPGVTDQARRAPHLPAGPPGTGPRVTFARSGITAAFGDAQQSLLELADACDVPARWSCRTGVCHTCTTHLLSGDVTYSPEPLEPALVGDVLICCSQPTSDVVLDM
jgi:ferredoxin-NADP reductase